MSHYRYEPRGDWWDQLDCDCPESYHPLPPRTQVREEPRTYGAAERREQLLARERAKARAEERESSAQRVYAWAASLSDQHDRLVAAKAAQVVLDPTR